MERNQELERLADIFVGDWALSITNQWWLDDPTEVTAGRATGEWLGSSFIRFRADINGPSELGIEGRTGTEVRTRRDSPAEECRVRRSIA